MCVHVHVQVGVVVSLSYFMWVTDKSIKIEISILIQNIKPQQHLQVTLTFNKQFMCKTDYDIKHRKRHGRSQKLKSDYFLEELGVKITVNAKI